MAWLRSCDTSLADEEDPCRHPTRVTSVFVFGWLNVTYDCEADSRSRNPSLDWLELRIMDDGWRKDFSLPPTHVCGWKLATAFGCIRTKTTEMTCCITHTSFLILILEYFRILPLLTCCVEVV